MSAQPRISEPEPAASVSSYTSAALALTANRADGDWHSTGLALHTVEVASIAVLIEAFANARLAREEQLRVEARLAAARRTGAPLATTRALAAEAACSQVRADILVAHAEKLLPKMHAPAVTGDTTATLMQ